MECKRVSVPTIKNILDELRTVKSEYEQKMNDIIHRSIRKIIKYPLFTRFSSLKSYIGSFSGEKVNVSFYDTYEAPLRIIDHDFNEPFTVKINCIHDDTFYWVQRIFPTFNVIFEEFTDDSVLILSFSKQ